MSTVYCTNCNEPCEAVEETWDDLYANGGKGGIYHSGVYVSDCCDAECTDEEPEQ